MSNMVNHPDHYRSKHGVEVIDIIEEFGLGFHLGNVVKYVLRAGHKSNELEDLEKAKWYLERIIDIKKTEEAIGAQLYLIYSQRSTNDKR